MLKWQKEARERDNNRCVMCHAKENLHVHHKDESRKLGTKLMNNDLKNLITLCKSCHLKIHGKTPAYPYKDLIIQLRKDGYTLGSIANILDINKAGLAQIINKYNNGKGTCIEEKSMKMVWNQEQLLKVRQKYGILIQ